MIDYLKWTSPIPNPRHATDINQLTMQREPNILSHNERRIFWFVASGHTNKQIAEILEKSQRTIEVQRSNVVEKLGGIRVVHFGLLAALILQDAKNEAKRAVEANSNRKKTDADVMIEILSNTD